MLLIDHVVKSKETRGRYALGAQHKLAGIAVAYSTDGDQARPTAQPPGEIKVKIEKDRHGHVRGHAQASVIAIAHIAPEDDGERVTVTLEAPEVSTDATGTWRPTIYMDRVAAFIASEPGATRNAITDGVTGQENARRRSTSPAHCRRLHRPPQGRSKPRSLHPPADEKPPGPTGSQPGPRPSNGPGSAGLPLQRDPDPGLSEAGPTNRVPGPGSEKEATATAASGSDLPTEPFQPTERQPGGPEA